MNLDHVFIWISISVIVLRPLDFIAGANTMINMVHGSVGWLSSFKCLIMERSEHCQPCPSTLMRWFGILDLQIFRVGLSSTS